MTEKSPPERAMKELYRRNASISVVPDAERTPAEQELLDYYARTRGAEFVQAHAAIILGQAYAVGDL